MSRSRTTPSRRIPTPHPSPRRASVGRSSLCCVAAALVLALTGVACDGSDAPDDAAAGDATGGETPTTDPATTSAPSDAEPDGSEPGGTEAGGTGSGGSEPDPTPSGPVELALTTVAQDLEAPWGVAFTPDGRVFVTERDRGRLLELVDGEPREVRRFAIEAQGEGGLLGLAASPDYERDGLLYAYLTTSADNRVVRFTPDGDDEPEVVLEGIPRARVHNGGRIAFGPDGMLYVGTGDAGDPDRAQDPDVLAGKILRLEPDGAVPADNPTPGSPVYALGLRNVQGFGWTTDGAMYAAELGPRRDDEVNRVEGGGNHGWPLVTGVAEREGLVNPVFVAQPPDASWSGLTVLDGGAIPQWEGDVFVAALRGQRLWRLQLGADGRVAASDGLLVGELGRLRAVAQAPDGALWLLTSNRDGRGDPRAGDDRVLRLGPAD